MSYTDNQPPPENLDLAKPGSAAAAILMTARIEAIMAALDARLAIAMPEPVAIAIAAELGYPADNTGVADMAIHYGAIVSRCPIGIILAPEEMES
jgi:hypothetical protein